MSIQAHEHFCSTCYSRGKVRGVTRGRSGRGWWQCAAKHCTRSESCPCAVHAATDATETP